MLVFVFYMGTANFEGTFVKSIYDKLQHLAAFITLAFLADFSFPRIRFLWKVALPLFVYGLILEFTQYFLPYRDFSVADIVANAVGILLYYYLAFKLLPRMFKTPQ